ncbi:carbon storage regulator [Legionella waltersii]|uniref:Carbon storage regulator CsrA n=1 Tax=Legionella waltersii TaxID=66969 RepID=A0A0W1A1K6_9GAMM|nr:carbon storage regulator [Legionella waltersii]KTD75008.1 carbon storage regulator CsrA [Legionella waltersii]SNV05588.1 carbon storage regulator CsrA [Legionella waltersii]
MDIINLQFEEPLIIRLSNKIVKILAFKTHENGNIKFGVDAPRSINVHREEIYNAIKEKESIQIAEQLLDHAGS